MSESDTILNYINECYSVLKETPYQVREKFVNELIQELIDESYDVLNKHEVLSRLGDLLLYDYVEGDTRPNKMQLEEYPIMSMTQYESRTRGKRQKLKSRSQAFVEAPLEDASFLESSGTPINLTPLE